jgi:hypothetical protein
MTTTAATEPPTTNQAPPPTVADYYDPVPSIPRLITEITTETFLTRYAAARGRQHFHPDYVRDREQTAMMLRAIVADLVALASGDRDQQAVGDAAAAATAYLIAWQVRPANAQQARDRVREAYRRWESSEPPHLPNCPGGCHGTGQLLTILIYQDDGTPLHQEPIDCDRGESTTEHPEDCICFGSGMFARGSENWVCLTYEPRPASEQDDPAPSANPWLDEPPF